MNTPVCHRWVMTLILQIDVSSPVPVYAQIVEQVKRLIAAGVIASGDALPSRRELAIQLEINPLTVTKAYKQLETEGLISIRHGLGCFVAAQPDGAVDEYRIETLTRAVDDLVKNALDFGVPLERIEEMLRDQVERARNGADDEMREDD